MMHKKVLILGFGSSGKAAKTLAESLGCETFVLEDKPLPRVDAASLPREKEEDSIFDVRGKDAASTRDAASTPAVAVVSPGIPLSSPLVAECRRCGIPLMSELQFGCEELKRQGWKLLAVTGSKGKSSVVKVVADAINLAGGYAVPCGNYGRPVCDVAVGVDAASLPREKEEDSIFDVRGRDAASTLLRGRDAASTLAVVGVKWAVVEVSSFMMETTDLPSDTFEAAAILNLQEDHLDRHGSVAVYHGLKRKLLTMALHSVDVSTRDAAPPLWVGSYFDNEMLSDNAACAVELMQAAGLSEDAIRRAFAEFRPLPHRMNTVATIAGVRYVDDSKATSLAALAAGVKMASSALRPSSLALGPSSLALRPSVLLIAGGLPKGDDPRSVLATLTERVRKVYLIGQSAASFSEAWKDAVDCEICGTLDRAVESVRREAVAGETVLLSPGTASFDQFKGFEERGEVFARLVKEKENDK